MAYNVLANFRTLACELARRAGSAMKTRGVGILMAGEPITAMGYESLDELDRESRWLLTLALLKDP